MKNDRCPNCGEATLYIKCELEKHELNENSGYELWHCWRCCSWFKAVWKFVKLIELKEGESGGKQEAESVRVLNDKCEEKLPHATGDALPTDANPAAANSLITPELLQYFVTGAAFSSVSYVLGKVLGVSSTEAGELLAKELNKKEKKLKERTRKRKYYVENREAILKRRKKWRDSHKDIIKKRNDSFRRRHPERARQDYLRRKEAPT